MNPEERRQFVREHRTAIFGYPRGHDGPAMSIVYYVLQDDEILVSTMAERAKAKAVARAPKVSLCVLDEQWPPSYLQIYCDARIDTDFGHVVDVMMSIAGVMAGIRCLTRSGRWSRKARAASSASSSACARTPPSTHPRCTFTVPRT